MATRWARVVRGLVAAMFAVFVAGFAHVAGGGSVPSLAGASVAVAFAALACIALAGRSLSAWRLGLSVVLSQGAFHVLFWMTGSGSSSIGAGATSATGTMAGMHAMSPGPLVPSSDAVAAPSPMPDSGWMWLAHGLAAVLTVVALRWGEAAFWNLLDAARLAMSRFARVPAQLAHPPRVAPIPDSTFDGREAHFLRTGLRHRGPPRVVAASA